MHCTVADRTAVRTVVRTAVRTADCSADYTGSDQNRKRRRLFLKMNEKQNGLPKFVLNYMLYLHKT